MHQNSMNYCICNDITRFYRHSAKQKTSGTKRIHTTNTLRKI